MPASGMSMEALERSLGTVYHSYLVGDTRLLLDHYGKLSAL
jgi:hypothetical protein